MLETLRIWLSLCPSLEGVPIRIDSLGSETPCAALMSRGLEQIWEKETILGDRLRRLRLRCLLRARFFWPGEQDQAETGERWLEIAQWVQGNPAPAFGERQTCRLEKGNLSQTPGDGSGIYEAVLTVEFTEKI